MHEDVPSDCEDWRLKKGKENQSKNSWTTSTPCPKLSKKQQHPGRYTINLFALSDFLFFDKPHHLMNFHYEMFHLVGSFFKFMCRIDLLLLRKGGMSSFSRGSVRTSSSLAPKSDLLNNEPGSEIRARGRQNLPFY
jgi:hypothetical protein